MSYYLTKTDPLREERARLALAILASLLLHVCLFVPILRSRPSFETEPLIVELVAFKEAPAKLPDEQLELDLSKLEPKQIVTAGEGKHEPPKETNLLSDQDRSVEKQSIRRGDPEAGARTAAPPPAESQQPQHDSTLRAGTDKTAVMGKRPKATELSPRPPLTEQSEALLRLDENRLAEKFAMAPAPGSAGSSEQPGSGSDERKPSDPVRLSRLEEYQPFTRRGDALFPGRYGSADYLPGVSDGEITMLNTKADRYAVFVRRVALQVFGYLKRMTWAELPKTAVSSLRQLALVNAKMSLDGKLLGVELQRSSGSPAFDRLLLEAVRRGATDQNPPPAAALPDGNIHFIFAGRTWAQYGGERTPEQRWLLLSTGLE